MGDHDWNVTTVWDDIGWTVRDRPIGGDSPVAAAAWRFEAYQHLGAQDGAPIYWRAGADSSMDSVSDLDDAEITMRASVKWDGCSHWDWNTAYWHGCGFNNILAMGEVMRRIYVLASQRISGWNAKSAGIPAGSEEVPAP